MFLKRMGCILEKESYWHYFFPQKFINSDVVTTDMQRSWQTVSTGSWRANGLQPKNTWKCSQNYMQSGSYNKTNCFCEFYQLSDVFYRLYVFIS